MPPQGDLSTRELVRKTIRKARKITAMLQGNMGLEGQGLEPKVLRTMKRATLRELLARRS